MEMFLKKIKCQIHSWQYKNNEVHQTSDYSYRQLLRMLPAHLMRKLRTVETCAKGNVLEKVIVI